MDGHVGHFKVFLCPCDTQGKHVIVRRRADILPEQAHEVGSGHMGDFQKVREFNTFIPVGGNVIRRIHDQLLIVRTGNGIADNQIGKDLMHGKTDLQDGIYGSVLQILQDPVKPVYDLSGVS